MPLDFLLVVARRRDLLRLRPRHVLVSRWQCRRRFLRRWRPAHVPCGGHRHRYRNGQAGFARRHWLCCGCGLIGGWRLQRLEFVDRCHGLCCRDEGRSTLTHHLHALLLQGVQQCRARVCSSNDSLGCNTSLPRRNRCLAVTKYMSVSFRHAYSITGCVVIKPKIRKG